MIQLSTILYISIFTFGLIGYLRGFDKELISLAGIVLALFTLVQFEDFFVSVASGSGEPGKSLVYLQALVLVIVAFFAYQTNPTKFENLVRARGGRDPFQSKLLGTATGAFNGYLICGSMWYFMHIRNYPIGSIHAPLANTSSAAWVDNLPLIWLLQGNLLTLLVIGLFLFILIAVI